MSAATSGRVTKQVILGKFSAPIAASTTIYAGTLVALNSSGQAVPVSSASTLRAVGRAATRGGLSVWDNASGSAGAFDVVIEEGIFYWDNGDSVAQADVGKVAYGVDDQTVAKSSNTGARSVAGVIRYVDTSDGVAVESSLALSRALLAEANASGIAITQTYSTAATTQSNLTSATLTDNSGGAANTTITAVTAAATITDSSGGVDPGNNTIAAITNAQNAGSADVVPTAAAIAQLAAKQNTTSTAVASAMNNFADLAAQVNALRVDLVNVKGVLNSVIDAMQANGSIG